MRFLHSMVRVKDLEKSMHFYCELLGLKEVYRNDYPAGKFTLVYLAAPEDYQASQSTKSPLIELTYNWDTKDYSGGPNFGHLAFLVDDIYSLCQSLQDNGVAINRPPRDGHMAFVKSPDGISIELLQKGEPLSPKEPWASMENSGSW